MLQAEAGGGSNKNVVIKDVSMYEGAERAGNSCIGIDARVKSTAAAGATMNMTVSGSEIYCHNTSEWTFHVAGSRDGAFTVNGTPIRSTDKDVGGRYLSRVIGVPTAPTAKVRTWRNANPYNSWHCFFDTLIANFNNTYGSCG